MKIAALLLAFAVAIPATAQQIQVNKDNRTIAITTTDSASAPADTAVISIGFVLYGKDQNATYADATNTSNAIVNRLESAGVPAAAITSVDQSLSPLEPSGDNDKVRYAAGLRFEFHQHWKVTVAADQAAETLHIAVLSGASDSGSIDWQLRRDDALQAEAAGKALEHARDIASRMAEGLGAKLGGLVYASNEAPARGLASLLVARAQLNTESASLAQVVKNLKPLAITPERIERSATVYAVFAIQ